MKPEDFDLLLERHLDGELSAWLKATNAPMPRPPL